MSLIKKTFVASLVLFTGIASASTGHIIKLYTDAEPTALQYIKNICISTNNGHSKACGIGATRTSSSGPKTVMILSSNLDKPFGFDESCRALRGGIQTPEGKGTFEIHTALHLERVNNVKVVSITQCTTNWVPVAP